MDVVTLDITMRLYYLGEADADKPSEMLLIEQEKRSGEFTSSIVAAKKGIYVFEFDNSYSWINSKTIRYENLIYSPLQIRAKDRHSWIAAYYDNVPSNEALPELITTIQKAPEKKAEKEYAGVANITKSGPFFNLKLTTEKRVYEFETDSEEKFVKRFNELT